MAGLDIAGLVRVTEVSLQPATGSASCLSSDGITETGVLEIATRASNMPSRSLHYVSRWPAMRTRYPILCPIVDSGEL